MQQKFVNPSRPDAENLTKSEKRALMFLSNLAGTLFDAKDDLKERVKMLEDGEKRLDDLAEGSLKLLNDLRTTIPMRQRNTLNNTALDYEYRLVPKLTPSSKSVVVAKEDFRELVDAAQYRCRECIEDSESAKKCKLYQILASTVPLEYYPDMGLCPYNLAGWEN